MPTCQIQAVKGITDMDMKTCVSSYVSSLRYMKKIVPLTIYNIVYNRVNFDENLFTEKCVCNISFKTFKSKIKNHILADVFYWVKDVIDAIDRKYLGEMHLIFKSNVDNIIIEDYKFTFSYEDKPNVEILPNSEDVINVTQKLFQNIESLSEFKKMDDDIDIFIEMMLFDNCISEKYDPPNFVRSTGVPLSLQTSSKLEYNTIGTIKTGYHKFKCSVKGATFAVESRASSVVIDDINKTLNEIDCIAEELNRNENAEQEKAEDEARLDCTNSNSVYDVDELISVHSNSTVEVEEPDAVLDKDNVRCPCAIKASIGSTKLIKCSICSMYQHVICVGCIDLASVKTPYICVYCNSNDNEAFDTYLLTKEQGQWNLICGFRLVVSYCYYFEKLPVHLLQRLDQEGKNEILMLLKRNKLVKFNRRDGSFSTNKDSLVTIMTSLFSDFHLPATMTLDDSTDMAICA